MALFSDTATGRVKRAAQSMTAEPGCARLRTNAFAPAGEVSYAWLSASRDEETDLWHLVRYHKTPVGPWSRTTLSTTAFFFDAVRACAEFEAGAAGQSMMMRTDPLPGFPADTVPHYRAAGEAAGVPFDINDMPWPALDGEPVSDGEFDEHAFTVAERTKGRKAAPVKDAQAMESIMRNLSEASSDPVSRALEKHKAAQKTGKQEKARKQHIELYLNALEAGSDVARALMKAVRENFSSHVIPHFDDILPDTPIYKKGTGQQTFVEAVRKDAGPWMIPGIPIIACITAIKTVCYVPLLAINGIKYARGNPDISTVRHYITQQSHLADHIKKLPDGEDRDLLTAFSRAANGVFALEQAAQIQTVIVEKGARLSPRKYKSLLESGSALIEEGAGHLELPPEDAGKLKAAFCSKNFPAPETFFDRTLHPYSLKIVGRLEYWQHH